MSTVDRRVQRSERLAEALDLLLESCRRRGGFEAMIVADDDGLLVGAASTSSVDPEELASLVSCEARRPTGARFTAQSFSLRGERLYVAGVGGMSNGPMHDAVRGAQRILA